MDSDHYASAIQKFRPNDLTVHRSAHWSALLRARQITLGSLVLLPTRQIGDFDEVLPEVGADFFLMVARSQRALRHQFSPDRFNLIAAMMKDAFVHFHLIPRYEQERSFAGTNWRDADWPQLVSFRNAETDPSVEILLISALRAEFRGAEVVEGH